MPISGDYTFEETPDEISIAIPLKGCSPKTLDVLLTKSTLRVSYLPFLLDLALANDVDDVHSKAVLKDGVLNITLIKLEKGVVWGKLLFDGTKTEIAARRQRALVERTERVQRQHQDTMQRRVDEERMMLKKQMSINKDERKRIDDKKTAEKQAAEKELYEALAKMEQQAKEKEKTTTKTRLPLDAVERSDNNTPATSIESDDGIEKENFNETNMSSTTGSTAPYSLSSAKKDRISTSTQIPPPRQAIRSTFKHTPRLFTTPARESTIKQEQEFIMKNQPKLCGRHLAKGNETDIIESDPNWLMQKGQQYASKGDYASAVNAYSAALDGDRTLMQAMAERATSYLQLGDTEKAISDCKEAIEAIASSTNSGDNEGTNDSALTERLLVCMANAKCHSGRYDEGLALLQKHMDTVIDNEDKTRSVLGAIERVTRLKEAMQFKQEADDVLLQNGKQIEALELYDTAIGASPELVTAVANRSVCHLALQNYIAAKEDCEAAIDLLNSKNSPETSLASASFGAFPLSKSAKRRNLQAALISRRQDALLMAG